MPDSAIHVLFANGLHKAPSRKERRDIVGPEIAGVWPLVAHDPKRGCARIGSVEVAKPVLEADRVILLSSAGFHYLAGYGGGWKLLFPGCASERTILALHRRTLESGAEPGRLPGNPFRRAIREAGALIPTPTRSLHVVLDEHRKVVAAESGAPESSLRTIAKKVSQLFEVRIRNRADLVIASAGGHPKDIDLIQSHKAIHYAARAGVRFERHGLGAG